MNRLQNQFPILLAAAALVLLQARPAAAQNSFVLRGVAVETVGKAGRIENGQILVVDGIIREVGEKVSVPDSARVLDLKGRTVLPGIVDPYFVVNFSLGAAPAAEEREVSFGGRTFRVPGNQGRTPPVSFVRVADVFDARPGSWEPALRSGITTVNIVTSGYGQSALGNPLPERLFGLPRPPHVPAAKPAPPPSPAAAGTGNAAALPEAETFIHPILFQAAGGLYTTVTNDTVSLKTIRDGLRDPAAARPASGDPAAGSAQAGSRGPGTGRGRGGRGDGGGGPPAGRPDASTGAATEGAAPASDPSQKLWQAIRSGEKPLLVNANNASAILYLLQEHDRVPAVRLAVVASGSDWFQTLEHLQNRKLTVVLPPRIDTHPLSRDRLNVPRLLGAAGIGFVFSLSTGQTDYRAMQHNPLFPVAMLMKSGLTRQQALEALTIGPAKLLGLEAEIGTIEVGKRADLVVFDADPFDASAGVEQVWVGGRSVFSPKD